MLKTRGSKAVTVEKYLINGRLLSRYYCSVSGVGLRGIHSKGTTRLRVGWLGKMVKRISETILAAILRWIYQWTKKKRATRLWRANFPYKISWKVSNSLINLLSFSLPHCSCWLMIQRCAQSVGIKKAFWG